MFGLEDVLSNLFEKAPEDTQVTANRERERESHTVIRRDAKTLRGCRFIV